MIRAALPFPGRAWLLALLFAAVCGCGSPQPTAPASGANEAARSAPAGTRGLIGVSLLTLDNPFFKVIGDHLTAEAEKHGYAVLVLSADRDASKQSQQVRDFLVQKVVAIVLSPCESRAVAPAIQEANAAGVPVFTVDIPCDEPGVQIACQIATDNVEGGRQAAQAMIEALGEAGGKVAILHMKQVESCRLRVQGFREVLDAFELRQPGRIQVVAELEGGGDKAEGLRATEDLLQTHGDLRGIFAINDPSALGARAALEKANKAAQVVIVGFDGQPEGRQAIKDGKIYADPIQFPDRMGTEAVRAYLKHARGESLPPKMLIPPSLYRKTDAEQDATLK